MRTIKVSGMSCQHCQKAVAEALEELGLGGVSVDLEGGTASFEEDAAVSDAALKEAIEDAGYEVEL